MTAPIDFKAWMMDEWNRMRDTERLDWLQAQSKGYGNGWVCRNSISGRGMRLHETGGEAAGDVRAAIDAAMERENGEG